MPTMPSIVPAALPVARPRSSGDFLRFLPGDGTSTRLLVVALGLWLALAAHHLWFGAAILFDPASDRGTLAALATDAVFAVPLWCVLAGSLMIALVTTRRRPS